MKDLKDKNILITGAASGIGRMMAVQFAAEGARCVACDINPDGLESLKKEITEAGHSVRTYVCDITDAASLTKLFQEVDSDVPQLDILVNNAGIVLGKNFLDLTIEDFRKTMEVNFFGHLRFTKHFLPRMVERNSGHIVNIASSAGLQGFPGAADYNASKFAEVGLTEALRLELKKMKCYGVKTTLVCPYVIDTGMFHGFKPLLLNPILKPDYVVRHVLAGIKKEKPLLLLPFSVNLTLLLKLFPTNFSDRVLHWLGMTGAMDSFRGRHK